MANPLFQCLTRNVTSNLSPLSMLESNPATREIAQLIRNGKSPKDIFFEQCRMRNVDPNKILSQMKGYK